MENQKNLEKVERIYLFLKEVNKDMSKEDIRDLYLNKYKLNEKSSSINIRVLNRFVGIDNKFSEEKSKEIKKVLKESLKSSKLNYNDLLAKIKIVKEKTKRSNKASNYIEVKNFE